MAEISQILSAATALAAVLIGPFITFKATQKRLRGDIVSNNRHKWISDLRDILANVNATAMKLGKFRAEMLDSEPNEDGLALYTELLVYIEKSKLYLNPNQKTHQSLQNALDHLGENVSDAITKKHGGIGADLKNVTRCAQDVLKEAWEQIKTEAT